MTNESNFEQAIADAVGEAVPAESRPFVVGDHISVVEVMFADGMGMVVLAPEMKPRHLSMLAQAIDQTIQHQVHPISDTEGEEGAADEA